MIVREVMSYHLARSGAQTFRDRLDRNVQRVATGGRYSVERWGPFWRVVKEWAR